MQDNMHTLYIWIFLGHSSLSGFKIVLIFFQGATIPSGRGLPHYRDFVITLRHITIGRTPLNE
jgi:hypothetical protein